MLLSCLCAEQQPLPPDEAQAASAASPSAKPKRRRKRWRKGHGGTPGGNVVGDDQRTVCHTASQQQASDPWDLSAAVDPSKHGQARQRERSRLRAVLWRNQAAERRAEQVRLKQAREASLDAQLQRAITSLERRDEQLERMGEGMQNQRGQTAAQCAKRRLSGVEQQLAQREIDAARITAQNRPLPSWLQEERNSLQSRRDRLLVQQRLRELDQEANEEVECLAAYPPTPTKDPAEQSPLPPRQVQLGEFGQPQVGFWAQAPPEPDAAGRPSEPAAMELSSAEPQVQPQTAPVQQPVLQPAPYMTPAPMQPGMCMPPVQMPWGMAMYGMPPCMPPCMPMYPWCFPAQMPPFWQQAPM